MIAFLLFKMPMLSRWCFRAFMAFSRRYTTVQVLFLIPVVAWLLWMPRLFEIVPEAQTEAPKPIESSPPIKPPSPFYPTTAAERDSGQIPFGAALPPEAKRKLGLPLDANGY